MTEDVMALPRGEIRALTGLRGVAAALVVLLHLPPYGMIRNSALHQVLNHGYLAVDLFFMLSGYLMALAYGDGFASRRNFVADYTHLLWRRFGRIYPMLVLATALSVALCLAGFQAGYLIHPLQPRQLLANFAGIQAWDLAPSIDPPCWSISIEFIAYLLLPGLLYATLRSRLAIGVACYAASVLTLAAVVLGTVTDNPHASLNIVAYDSVLPVMRCMAGFVVGLLSFRVSAALAGRRCGAVWPAAALALTLLAMAWRPADLLLVTVLFPFLVLTLVHGTGWPVRLLQSGPMHRLGVWSYTLYLIHYPIGWSFVAWVGRVLPGSQVHASWGIRPGSLVMLGSYLVVLVATGLVHQTIEQPLLRLFRSRGVRARDRSFTFDAAKHN